MLQKQTILKFCFVLLIGCLTFPFLQEKYGIVENEPLMGYFEKAQKPTFSKADWFSGDYQKQHALWFQDNIGLKNTLVRTYNQLLYTFLSETSAKKVVVGKEGVLYEDNYIDAYLGDDFAGRKKLEKRIETLKKVQDNLLKEYKYVLVVLAPSKARFFPEYIPDEWMHEVDTTNYEVTKELLAKNGINFIDFNDYFLKQKEKSEYQLYPQCGIHWSLYGASIAADSISSKLASIRNKPMPKIEWDGVYRSSEYQDSDYDIGEAMNLMYKATNEELGYPEVELTLGSVEKPRTIIVGDSYYNVFFRQGYHEHFFGESEFWYYNNQVFTKTLQDQGKVSDKNLAEEIEKTEVFMLMFTESNLHDLGFSFIENVWKELDPSFDRNSEQYKADFERIENNIRGTPEWMSQVEIKANDRGISVEDQLRLDIEWQMDQERNNQ